MNLPFLVMGRDDGMGWGVLFAFATKTEARRYAAKLKGEIMIVRELERYD